MTDPPEVRGDFEPFLRTIGALVVNFNVVDHALRRIAWHLIDAKDERIGQIVVDAIGIVKLEELVSALSKHRTLGPELRNRIDQAITQCKTVREQRNKYVHAFWRIPNDAVDLSCLEATKPPTRRSAAYHVVDATASVNILQSVSRSAYEIGQELEAILAALPLIP